MSSEGIPIRGSIKSFHTFVDFSNYSFPHPNRTQVTTCPAALGYSFAAGTTDGPGAFDFKQNNSGEANANPLWAAVRGFLKEPSEAQKKCHGAKPILLDVGEITRPYLWTPNVVDVQILRVGQLLITVSPGEATTMAGRRWKAAIKREADGMGLSEDPAIVVLGGPANSYTHYIATEEEYAVQRYEGASTLYGPHTLNAHIHASMKHLPYLRSECDTRPDPGPSPPNHVNKSLSFINDVIYDRSPLFKSFGDYLGSIPEDDLQRDQIRALATARFVSANPRNDLKLGKTYVTVERKKSQSETGKGEQWEVVRNDSDWFLYFSWRLTSTVLGTSEVMVVWECEDKLRKIDGTSISSSFNYKPIMRSFNFLHAWSSRTHFIRASILALSFRTIASSCSLKKTRLTSQKKGYTASTTMATPKPHCQEPSLCLRASAIGSSSIESSSRRDVDPSRFRIEYGSSGREE